MKSIFLSRVVTALIALTPVLSAEGLECHDTSYYAQHFATAKNPEAFHLAWARCEKSLGHESEALSAYERVLLYNPNNTEALIAIVPLYRATGMTQEAKRVLEGIDLRQLNPQEQKAIQELKGVGSFDLTTKLEGSIVYGYDTNINYNIFADDKLLTVQKAQESPFYAIDIKGSLAHKFESNDALSLQSHLGIYYKDNRESDYFDMTQGQFDVGLGYDTSTFSVYVPVVYNRMGYLDRDLYGQYGVAPRVTMSIGEELLLNLGVKYLKREYIRESDKNSNDTLSSASVGVYKFFGDDFVYGQIDYGKNETDATAPAPFSGYDFVNLFIGGSHELKQYKITLGANYLYSKRKYDDAIATGVTTQREDEYHQVQLSFKRKIDTHWTLMVDATYLDNTSNYALIDYDKTIMSFGFQYTY
jgi:tetratricopeptide (TPR) repeat protein